jgi:hypothetical protein
MVEQVLTELFTRLKQLKKPRVRFFYSVRGSAVADLLRSSLRNYNAP